jgi:hypothetical protein
VLGAMKRLLLLFGLVNENACINGSHSYACALVGYQIETIAIVSQLASSGALNQFLTLIRNSFSYNTSLLFTSAGDQLPFLSPSRYRSLIVLQDRNEVARQHSGETRCKGTLKSPNAYPDPAALYPDVKA